jgi:hypothetical protein
VRHRTCFSFGIHFISNPESWGQSFHCDQQRRGTSKQS